MKRLINPFNAFLLLVSLVGCGDRKERAVTKPGIPMEMLRAISRPTSNVVISDQPTVRPVATNQPLKVPFQGYITYDERRNNSVSVRVGGRIEKLYVKYNNEYVKQGTRILDLYSPELNTYQEEFLFLLKSGHDPELVESGKAKLRLLGLSDSQIRQLEKNGRVSFTISVYSPHEGYIVYRSEGQGGTSGMETPASGGSSEGMAGNNQRNSDDQPASGPGGLIREGGNVGRGQLLFSVNDLEQVWAIASVESKYQPYLKPGEAVEVRSELAPDRMLNGQVGLIEPIYQPGQKFTQARVYVKNPGRLLKINSLLSGEIFPVEAQGLTVPTSSVYDLGRRKIVWVLQGFTPNRHKIFEARSVRTGVLLGNQIQILAGVTASDQLARDAGYLVDSEDFILPRDQY